LGLFIGDYMRDEDVLILLGLGALVLSGLKRVEARPEIVKYVKPEVEYKAPPEVLESPRVKSEIEKIAVQPVESMLITSPDQPVQIQPIKPPEEIKIQPVQLLQPQPIQPIQPKEEKPPCYLRGSGYPWNWIDCGIAGYMNCLDQILGAFPDSRLACGVLVYLYKNNMINDYCCHRYCVYCDDICYGWASKLVSGRKISGYCDEKGNCYIEGGIQVYPFDKEYVLSTNDQILIASLRQLGCI